MLVLWLFQKSQDQPAGLNTFLWRWADYPTDSPIHDFEFQEQELPPNRQFRAAAQSVLRLTNCIYAMYLDEVSFWHMYSKRRACEYGLSEYAGRVKKAPFDRVFSSSGCEHVLAFMPMLFWSD